MVFKKRAKWCVKDKRGLRKFTDKWEAYRYAGMPIPFQMELPFEEVEDDIQAEESLGSLISEEKVQKTFFKRS